MRVDHAMILNVINQPADPVETMRALMEDNHEDERGRRRLSEQAAGARRRAARRRRARVARRARRGRPHAAARRSTLQDDFALNQPLASFALEAFELLDPESENYALDVLSVVEAILDDPFPVLMAQANKARGEAVAAMKADGHRVRGADGAARGGHLPEAAGRAAARRRCALYRETHPWVRETDLSPKSVVRDMYEWGRTLHRVRRATTASRAPRASCCATSATPTARCARRCPSDVKTDELDDIIEWLGETVRQTDSSLLDEWEALTDPESVARAPRPPRPPASRSPPPRPITANERAFARDGPQRDVPEGPARGARRRSPGSPQLEAAAAALTDPPARVAMNAAAWEEALGAYWDEYETMDAGPGARARRSC